jgi:hypothetical protein
MKLSGEFILQYSASLTLCEKDFNEVLFLNVDWKVREGDDERVPLHSSFS